MASCHHPRWCATGLGLLKQVSVLEVELNSCDIHCLTAVPLTSSDSSEIFYLALGRIISILVLPYYSPPFGEVESRVVTARVWCFGVLVSCKCADESQVFIYADSDRVVPNSSVALHVAESNSTQQSTVDHTHQPDIRPESANSVNPVILSNTAKLVVDSECFEFATQF